jgi:tetratricopeptide (TPR) repeat protein
VRARPTLVLFAALVIGCQGILGSPPITRTIGGRARPGIFVSPYSYEHFVRGELAFIAGDLRGAAQAYERARAGPEDDPLLIARLAEVYDRLGRERDALSLLDEGEALDARSELVWLARGRIHERHGRPEEAIDAYARASSAAPLSEEAPLALAALFRSQDRAEEADGVLARYLDRARGPGAARARLLLAIEHERPEAVADAVRALLEVAPARADEVRQAASTALDGDRPELALRLLSAIPERDEDRALRLRATIAAGDRDRAEGLLAAWMPSEPEELAIVARAYHAIGMPDRAAELARVSIAAGGGPEARLLLGEALGALGRWDEALRELAQIDPASGAWPDAPILMGRTLRAAGWPALAAELLARASRRRSSAPLAIALAEARVEAGDGDGALAALGAEDAIVRAARARLLERLGRVDGAAQVYAALRPDDPDIHERERARARVERAWTEGERDEALRALDAWIDRAPADLLSRARYAELLAAADRADEARTIAGQILALAVDAPLRARLEAIVAR